MSKALGAAAAHSPLSVLVFLVVSITSVYSSSVDSVSTDVLKIHCHFGEVVETVGVLCGKRQCVDRNARSALSRPCRPRPPLLASSFCLRRVACVKANMIPKSALRIFSDNKFAKHRCYRKRLSVLRDETRHRDSQFNVCVCEHFFYLHPYSKFLCRLRPTRSDRSRCRRHCWELSHFNACWLLH